MAELHEGLKDVGLNNFDVMLSGYCPSAALVEQVGLIARERKLPTTMSPGSFFWVLDPVMGDNGRIYVAEDTIPAYKGLLKDADLILPNQFEAELLSEVKIHDLASLSQAITKLHKVHKVPHVLITSVRLPPTTSNTPTTSSEGSSASAKLSVIGSTATSDWRPRLFRVTIPAFPVFFSGTGDMFAGILVARLREAAQEAKLLDRASWRSDDEVDGPDLPLAKATEKVLASMHAILKDTAEHYKKVSESFDVELEQELNQGTGEEAGEDNRVEKHLRLTRAAEIRVVRNTHALREPPDLESFRAQKVDVEVDDTDYTKPDELGVLRVSGEEGAVHQT